MPTEGERLLADETCTWSEYLNDWTTECGNTFTLLHGGPADNGMRFCCYCGAGLVEERSAVAIGDYRAQQEVAGADPGD